MYRTGKTASCLQNRQPVHRFMNSVSLLYVVKDRGSSVANILPISQGWTHGVPARVLQHRHKGAMAKGHGTWQGLRPSMQCSVVLGLSSADQENCHVAPEMDHKGPCSRAQLRLSLLGSTWQRQGKLQACKRICLLQDRTGFRQSMGQTGLSPFQPSFSNKGGNWCKGAVTCSCGLEWRGLM